MNFAIFNNNTVSTFDNNIIGFPSTNDHQFVLTRENTNGSITYSCNKPISITDIDFTTQNAEYFLTTSIINLDLKGNLIKKFKSAKEAAEELNGNYKFIRNCAAGYKKSAYGYIWKYE